MVELDEIQIRELVSHGGYVEFCAWKCHKPHFPVVETEEGSQVQVLSPKQREQATRRVHRLNLFEPLSEQPGIRIQGGAYENGMVVRGATIRAILAFTDKLPEAWEKAWQLLYLLDGVYYFTEPDAKVYGCDPTILCLSAKHEWICYVCKLNVPGECVLYVAALFHRLRCQRAMMSVVQTNYR